MRYDKQIVISTGSSRRATRWIPSTMQWSELVEKLSVPTRGTETLMQYLALSKGRQDDLKDVGGFVAGAINGLRRKAGAVAGRDVVTLDFDNVPAGGTNDVLMRVEGLGCAYCVYSTRKHEAARPRLRVLLPTNRTVTADEYEPIARKLAQIIGIELCDPSTFEASRLMYWPSCSADSDYVYVYGDKPFADADALLALFEDWRDVSQWPVVPGAQETVKKAAEKQADPTAKDSIVGAFCRVYDVYRAMDELLPGVYLPCETMPGRYTYSGGSTFGGAVIYDDGNFLFSHHATDPAGGKLCNAFDLVRLHKFGAMDDEAREGTPVGRLPSFLAMRNLACADPAVTTLLNSERYTKMTTDFGAPLPDERTAADPDWLSRLAISQNTGRPEKTTDNVLLILDNDPLLAGKIAFDAFSNRGLVLGALPWSPDGERRDWTDVDDAGLRHYLEKVYEITGKDRILDAVALCAHKHLINDVTDYLNGLIWDGVARLDSLLIDYLGAADTEYNRKVTRKALAATAARALVPGIKFDEMTILVGPQGIGKSTLLRIMGGRWYSDSLVSFEGKEASEMIQGVWINELGELSGLSRSETNTVKQFLTRTEDIYREPFGRRTGRYPRRCTFFGTSNENEFLRDATGSRRFWPVTLMEQIPVKSVFMDLAGERDQIWAEAKEAFLEGERLFLTAEEEGMARAQQERYKEISAKEGMIRGFAARKVPADWQKRTISQRLAYWGNDFGSQADNTLVARDRICALEVWCECFLKRAGDIRMADTKEINAILSGLEGWERSPYPIYIGPQYGQQRGFKNLLQTFTTN